MKYKNNVHKLNNMMEENNVLHEKKSTHKVKELENKLQNVPPTTYGESKSSMKGKIDLT